MTSSSARSALAARVGFRAVPVEEPGGPALTRFRGALERLERGTGQVRVLQLGDSHLAADLISGATRAVLGARFGLSGRGLVHADQRFGFGGRRLRRREADWRRTRVVEPRGPGGRYGLFGLALSAARRGAVISYRIRPEDLRWTFHYDAGPGTSGFEVWVGGRRAAHLDAGGGARATRTASVAVRSGDGRPRVLRLVARGPGATVFGAELSAERPGLMWSAVGPVGADARVYLQLDPDSFEEALHAHRPHLVVLMVGGNDALKVRKRWRSLDEVQDDLRKVVARLRAALPAVEILAMAPMDAGRRRADGQVRSKRFIEQVRDGQREVAEELRLAYWDTLAAMGGPGSVARWARAGAMNRDLVHPRGAGADVLGAGFAEAILRWYDAGGSL